MMARRSLVASRVRGAPAGLWKATDRRLRCGPGRRDPPRRLGNRPSHLRRAGERQAEQAPGAAGWARTAAGLASGPAPAWLRSPAAGGLAVPRAPGTARPPLGYGAARLPRQLRLRPRNAPGRLLAAQPGVAV